MNCRSVGVVGGGLTGLACALALAQAGAVVDLYDEHAPGEGLAAHVDVVPNMLRDLVRLGVGEACVRAGFPYRRTSVLGQRAAPLVSLDAPRLAGPRYPAALGITHAKLHAVLADAARAAGVRLHAAARVLDVDQEAAPGARLHVANRPPVQVDLAVLASGGRGGLRERVLLVDALPPGREWSYFLARRPLGLDEALHAAAPTGERAHVVPVSGSQVGVRLASSRPMAADRATLRHLLARFPGVIGALATHVDETMVIARRQFAPGLLPTSAVRGAVLAVGDCAHAMPPHFGQSAAQGIEDALVLAELWPQAADARALTQAFAERRAPRVQQVMAITLQAARWDAAPDGDTDFLQLARALDLVVQQPA